MWYLDHINRVVQSLSESEKGLQVNGCGFLRICIIDGPLNCSHDYRNQTNGTEHGWELAQSNMEAAANGARSFNRRSLHHIRNERSPYEEAISIIGRTLASFDEDNLIPYFGFRDASTHDQEVFSFLLDGNFCDGFEEVWTRCRELVPQLRLDLRCLPLLSK